MGVVWRAHDTLLKRYVAVKEVQVPPTMPRAERELMEKRVLREARAAGQLSHPAVVAVYDVTQDEGRSYIVMELVDAPTLAHLVAAEGPLAPRRAAQIGLDILGALELAHANGIVHRDVKPGNVMVPQNGSAKLADFGIASVTGDPKLTASGMILGSPSFMAPEQATDAATTPATDLWALGGVLYYAVVGKPPFDKGQAIPTLTAVLHDELEIDHEVTRELTPVITAALHKDATERASTETMRSLLQAALDGEASAPMVPLPKETVATPAPAPEPVETPPPARRPTSTPRRPGTWIAVAVIGILAAATAAFFLFGRDDNDAGVADGGREQPRREEAEEPQGPVVPAGFTTYTDEEIGYTAAYPEGWSISDPGRANATDFRDETTGTYLRVDWVQPPNGTPEGAWEAAAASSPFDTIAITPTTYRGMDAALWEYTYSDGGAELHAYNLGFITPDGKYGMALNFQTHAENWESSQALWEQLKAGFATPD